VSWRPSESFAKPLEFPGRSSPNLLIGRRLVKGIDLA
jgi:hypothetical protein